MTEPIEHELIRSIACVDIQVVKTERRPTSADDWRLKQELVYSTDFATRHQARSALFEYIEVFYNRKRRHSSLGYLSPVDFELANLPTELAA